MCTHISQTNRSIDSGGGRPAGRVEVPRGARDGRVRRARRGARGHLPEGERRDQQQQAKPGRAHAPAGAAGGWWWWVAVSKSRPIVIHRCRGCNGAVEQGGQRVPGARDMLGGLSETLSILTAIKRTWLYYVVNKTLWFLTEKRGRFIYY